LRPVVTHVCTYRSIAPSGVSSFLRPAGCACARIRCSDWPAATMQVAQRALSQRSSVRCSTASVRHKVGRPSTGIPFTTSRTRVTCEAAKKGKQAAQSKKKTDANQSSSIASSKPAQLTPEAEPVESAAESRRTPTLTEPRPADINQDASAVAAQPIESSAEPPTNGASAAGSADEQATSSYTEEATPAAAVAKVDTVVLS
jgi:hypothetical protein